MRFTNFLKVTVLANATSFGVLTAIAVNRLIVNENTVLLIAGVTWLVIAALGGLLIGRQNGLLESISKLLISAKVITREPEDSSFTVIINRLWLLILVDIACLVLAFFTPQVTIIAAGFALFLSLIWRKQVNAVASVESQELVNFYVAPSSPLSAIELVKVPGRYPGDESIPNLKLAPSSSQVD